MVRIVVSDTTAITHLAKINSLNILQSVYGKILIPEAVFNELCQAKVPQAGERKVRNASWIQVVPIKNMHVANPLKKSLD
ncbi:hypothetical protein MHK_001951, partial [Candidatus Magnetomorum sp. HK-1]